MLLKAHGAAYLPILETHMLSKVMHMTSDACVTADKKHGVFVIDDIIECVRSAQPQMPLGLLTHTGFCAAFAVLCCVVLCCVVLCCVVLCCVVLCCVVLCCVVLCCAHGVPGLAARVP